MVNATGWEVAHADQFGRFDPAMSGNRSVGCVDKYRVDKPEFLYAGLDLPYLLCGVYSGIVSARLQLRGIFVSDLQRGHGSLSELAENGDRSLYSLQFCVNPGAGRHRKSGKPTADAG